MPSHRQYHKRRLSPDDDEGCQTGVGRSRSRAGTGAEQALGRAAAGQARSRSRVGSKQELGKEQGQGRSRVGAGQEESRSKSRTGTEGGQELGRSRSRVGAGARLEPEQGMSRAGMGTEEKGHSRSRENRIANNHSK